MSQLTGEIVAEKGTKITRELADKIQNNAVPYLWVEGEDEERNIKILSNMMVDFQAVTDIDPEEVAVRSHEGKRILMPEKIGVSAITMPESEYGQIKLDLDTVNKKKDFAPVKFNNASRLIKQQNKGFALFSLCVILYFLCN